jgi:hypothetical protein
MANWCSGRDWRLVQPVTMWWPTIKLKARTSGFRRFDRRLSFQSSMSSILVVVVPAGDQFYLQIRCRPEQQLIQAFSADCSVLLRFPFMWRSFRYAAAGIACTGSNARRIVKKVVRRAEL